MYSPQTLSSLPINSKYLQNMQLIETTEHKAAQATYRFMGRTVKQFALHNLRVYFNLAALAGAAIGGTAGAVFGSVHAGCSKLANKIQGKTSTKKLKDYVISDAQKGFVGGHKIGRIAAAGGSVTIAMPLLLMTTAIGAAAGGVVATIESPLVYADAYAHNGSSSLADNSYKAFEYLPQRLSVVYDMVEQQKHISELPHLKV